MNHSPKEILNFIEENDVKFIRLTFTDIYGQLKNIAIMPNQLAYAFEHGIAFDTTTLSGNQSTMLLFPDITTLSVLPWRPKTGRVIRFFCDVKNINGTHCQNDLRHELDMFTRQLKDMGYTCEVGTKCEFYLFDTDEHGNPTKTPHDNAGYLDIAPLDKCENVRREICLSLEEMGLNPQSSRHSHGAGQNEIDFIAADAVTSADNMVYYKTIVKNIAVQNGLYASFMPKPMMNSNGCGLNISISVRDKDEFIFSPNINEISKKGCSFIAGILNRIDEITCFLNVTTNSYKRFNKYYPIIRIPYTSGILPPKIEICSADAACNPYIAFKLLLAAGFEGIENNAPLDINMLESKNFTTLPTTLRNAVKNAKASEFVRKNMSYEVFDATISKLENDVNTRKNDKLFEDTHYFPVL